MEMHEAKLDDLFISATNPRKHYDAKKLKELTESVLVLGVLQPVLARRAGMDAPAPLELIFGTRRFKAAKAAKLETIPVRLVEMTDLEILDAQAVENSQREDVHPLEEAELYEVMTKPPAGATYPARTVDQIAAKVGKSRGWVYGRMKLLELTKENRARFYDDKLDASTAGLLARIPNVELQNRAGKEITEEHATIGRMSFREAQRHVREQYMLRLSEAPFPIADSTLSMAGPCTSCPKRTGNQKELFADVDSADVCTDPPCFQVKVEAAWKLKVQKELAKGREVLTAKISEHVFKYGNDRPDHGSGYVRLDDVCHDDPKGRTYKELLGKLKTAKIAVAKAPTGKAVELVPTDGLKAQLREAGHKFAEPKKKDPQPARNDDPHEGTDRAFKDGLIAAIVAAVEKKEPTADQWRTLLEVMLYDSIGHDRLVAERRGLGQVGLHAEDDVVGLAAKMNAEQLRGLYVEATACHIGGYENFVAPELERLCKAFGIDKVKVKAAVKAAAKAAAGIASIRGLAPVKVIKGKSAKKGARR